MKFSINTAAFCRLASIPAFFEPGTDPEIIQQFSCVRIESNNGRLLAISTNQKIAAVEYLGPTNEPNTSVNITIDPVLITQLKKEIPFNGFFEVVYIPEILTASIKTMTGFTYAGNASVGLPEQSVLKDWRRWIPTQMPKKGNGAMYWNVDHIQTLAASSPSGKIIFPEHIDIDTPVIIRDVDFPHWFGVFMAKTNPTEPQHNPATLPEWL